MIRAREDDSKIREAKKLKATIERSEKCPAITREDVTPLPDDADDTVRKRHTLDLFHLSYYSPPAGSNDR